MQTPQLPMVNLVKNRGESFWDRFVAWALTAGRIVVITTEGIALAAFLYRFSLDRTLVDLHDHISQEQTIIGLLKNNEATYRNLQSRLMLAKTITTQVTQTTSTFNDIFNLIPSDMTVTTFEMTTDTIRIEGTLQSITSLRTFVDKLKAYPLATSVSLDKIQTNTATATVTGILSVLLKTTPIATPL